MFRSSVGASDKEYHHISLIEDREFKQLIHMLNTGYDLVTRKNVTNTILPNLYLSELEKLEASLQTVVDVS